jgi:formylglycine-generating enzyme required for sulfatase activity
MRKLIVFLLLGVWQLAVGDLARANNLAVSNAAIATRSGVNQTANVQFDITWQNSWRTALNYDAVWVFVKYSTDSGVTWLHATLKTSGTNPSGFAQGTGTGLDIVVPTDKKGAFLQRSANGTGTVSTADVELVWDWGAAGLSSSSTARVKVFAIEMVYIPTGTFSLGSGGTETAAFYSSPTTTNPYSVSSENAITVGTSAGNLRYTSGVDYGDMGGPVPANFPKGYNNFYIMKYEISQGQYRDFLNTLTRTQQLNRAPGLLTANQYVLTNDVGVLYRQGIRAPASIPGSGPVTVGCDLSANGTFNEAADGEWIACNYLSIADGCAYAAWAGLRPLTELEFEKACRGTQTPLANEYPWGSISLTGATSITNSGANNEVAGQTGNGLCNYNNGGVAGPLRCGFAATSTTNRITAGSSYYGVMELAGNLWERPVNIGSATGRGFIGSNGSGTLSANGNATNSDWPGFSAGEVTGVTGSGFRGGAWLYDSSSVPVSARLYAARELPGKDAVFGYRLGRTP